jgi:hypothetical protein
VQQKGQVTVTDSLNQSGNATIVVGVAVGKRDRPQVLDLDTEDVEIVNAGVARESSVIQNG